MVYNRPNVVAKLSFWIMETCLEFEIFGTITIHHNFPKVRSATALIITSSQYVVWYEYLPKLHEWYASVCVQCWVVYRKFSIYVSTKYGKNSQYIYQHNMAYVLSINIIISVILFFNVKSEPTTAFAILS